MKTCHELDYRYGYAMSYGTPIRVRRPNRPRYFKLEGVIKLFKGMPNICVLTNLILSILCRGNWNFFCCIGSIQVLIQVDKSGFFFSFMILIYFLKYETIVRSSAWSFGHSDPDPSSAQRCVLPVFFPVDLLLWQ